MKIVLIYVTALATFCAFSALSHAADKQVLETWTIGSKVFSAKGEAIRYIISTGKRLQVSHTKCEVLTNKLTFKACPKVNGFENEQFSSLKVTND